MNRFNKYLKHAIISVILIFGSFQANSQSLVVEPDNSMIGGICTGGDNVACVIITAPKELQLQFESTMDAKVNIAAVEESGGSNVHTLHFFTGSQYRGRILKITSQTSLTPTSLPLNLSPKEVHRYFVSDPDAGIGGKYLSLRAEGIALFKTAHYNEAKVRYQMAKECTDYISYKENSDIDVRINNIDSILQYRDFADESFDLLDYKAARDAYSKIIALNADDDYARKRYAESQSLQNQSCNRYMTTADSYFKEHEYEKAKELYEKVILQNCPRQELANAKLQEIAKIGINRRQQRTVFTYEIAKNLPIGFSIGGYKNRKTGGYFTLKTNSDLFNMFRSNYKEAECPEVDISGGLNFRPVKNKYAPIWINIGVGYTLLGAYYFTNDAGEEILYEGGELPETFDSSPEIYHAISPEIGLLGKVPLGKKSRVGIAIRYTFQYRFAIKSETQDYIRKTSHGFGIGLCF